MIAVSAGLLHRVMPITIAAAENSFLLWFLGVVIYALAAHVGMTAVRLARRAPLPRDRLSLVLTAGMAWGAAMSIGFVLALGAMSLPFNLGFGALRALSIWLLSSAVASAAAAALVRWPGSPAKLGAGVTLGAVAMTVQACWLWAAGFRPGLEWRPEVMAAAFVVMAIGLAIALGVVLSEPATVSRLRVRWRLAAAGLAALSWLAGQEIMLAGMGLGAQVGSLYQRQLSAPLLSLVGGALVPIVLCVVALDLRYGRKRRRRRHNHREVNSTIAPEATPRRPRKVRVRGL